MRRRLTLVLQLALASVAVFAVLWAVFGRPGDKAATPIAASGAVAGDSATGTAPPADSSFEPSSPAPIELLSEDAFDVQWRKPPRAALVFDVENGDSLGRRVHLEPLLAGLLIASGNDAAVARRPRLRQRASLRRADKRAGSAVEPRLHPLHDAERLIRPRPLLRRRPRRDDTPRHG